jgi:octaprenyl-diphosphate synthase
VLDYRSNPEKRGKNLGDDLAEGKPTLPLIHALRRGTDAQRSVIRQAIEQGCADLEPIISAIELTGGLDYAARLAQDSADQALEALKALPETPFKRGLAALAHFAVDHTT